MQTKPAPLLISAAQAAKILGVAPNAIPELREKHGLPFIKLGKRCKYSPAGIEAWVASKQTTAK